VAIKARSRRSRSVVVPALIADLGDEAAWRYVDVRRALVGGDLGRREAVSPRARRLSNTLWRTSPDYHVERRSVSASPELLLVGPRMVVRVEC
jgi:hypothetical protein